jgi:hypothetical protein
MKQSLRRIILGGTALACCTIAGAAPAQPAPPPRPPVGPIGAPPPPPPPPGGSTYYPQQLQETSGTILRFTLTPRGDLDGFLLADRTEVHLPPHLSAQLAAAVRPGDPVSVRGYRSATVPLIVANTVTNTSTNQSVVDQGPPPPGFGPPPSATPILDAQQTSLNGIVQAALYGPAGDLNGAILYDGTIIRMPPPVAYQFVTLLAPGQAVTVQGWSVSTAYGRVVDTQTIGPSTQTTQPPPPQNAPFFAPPPR